MGKISQVTAFWVALVGAPSVLISCGLAEPNGEYGGNQSIDEFTAIPQLLNDPVCTRGRWTCQARVVVDSNHAIVSSATPKGFTPSDLASAYALDATKQPTVTVAIVDAFNYVNAESDLATYRSQFGLPPCTKANGCLKIVNQNGAASPLPSGTSPDWEIEAALDLDMVSAACPSCNIVLVEAEDNVGNGLFVSQNAAAALPGVVTVSNSWGGPETSSDVSSDSQFFNHPNVSIFAATGDSGYTGSAPTYPSTSAGVTAVGGTRLVRSSLSRGWAESAWSLAGSSCSTLFAKLPIQTNTACANRAAADVSAVADPNTGVAIFDQGNGGWISEGGTSAASPLVAGIYARYGLGGRGPDYSYKFNGQFFDVTTGSNGSCGNALCDAGFGWDGPTGNGTPNGALLGHIPSQRTVIDQTADTGWSTIVPMNLNNDNLTDLLLYNKTTGRNLYTINMGNASEVTALDLISITGWTTIVPMNFNNDGLTDLFLYNSTTGRTIYAINQGNAGFSVAIDQMADPGWTSIVPMDLNNDGLTDLLLYNATTGRNLYTINMGNASEVTVLDLNSITGWTTIVPVNLNNDGLTDLFLYNATTGRTIYAINQGNAGFSTAVDQMADPGWTTILPVNLNNDNLTDLLLYNANTGRTLYTINVGGVGEVTMSDTTGPQGWTSIVPMNFNNDGLTDLISYNAATGHTVYSILTN